MIPSGRALALVAAVTLIGFAPGAMAQSTGAAAASGEHALTSEQAAERFQQGESFERKRNLQAAFDAYADAGESGHPLAQKKLGDFYSEGNVAVARDYGTALKWYQKAREQGVDIPGPSTYPGYPIDRWTK